MNRIGVRAEDAAQFALGLSDFPGLELEGTFTHFATADVPGDWEVERQFERFTLALEEMRTEGVNPGIVHAANSPATILYPRDAPRHGALRAVDLRILPVTGGAGARRAHAGEVGQGARDAREAHRAWARA